MKKLICLVCLLFLVIACVGCGCDSEIPNGYKLASDPEKDGFTLYVPEEWYVTHTGDAIISNVSGINTAAVTVARVETSVPTLAEYWAQEETAVKTTVADYAVTKGYPKETKVDECTTLVVDYTGHFPNKTRAYRVRQYLISTSDGIVIVTYTACNEANEITNEIDFNSSLALVEDLMVYFKPGKKGTGHSGIAVTDENAPEGMKNATVSEYIGLTVYVPETWRVEISDGFIGAVTPAGDATLTMTEINLTSSAGGQETLDDRLTHQGVKTYDELNGTKYGFLLIDYWNLLKAEFADYYDKDSFKVTKEANIAESKTEDGEVSIDMTPAVITEHTKYYEFSYTATHGGVAYEVTLYIFREKEGGDHQFRTLTYTTKQGEHEKYQADMDKILAEVRY